MTPEIYEYYRNILNKYIFIPYHHLTTAKKILLVTVLCAGPLWSNIDQLHRQGLSAKGEPETLVQIETMPLLVHTTEIIKTEKFITSPDLELKEENMQQKEKLRK